MVDVGRKNPPTKILQARKTSTAAKLFGGLDRLDAKRVFALHEPNQVCLAISALLGGHGHVKK